MAAYRCSVKLIKRSTGRSATAAAAYRAGVEINDERTGQTHNYARRKGVVHTEILAPDHAPDWMQDRSKLWNAVEQAERRKDAQLAREFQLNLPHELDDKTRLAITREFIQRECVDRGMVADIAVHEPDEGGDNRNHHAHVMVTLRSIDGEGFGKKDRSWNDTALLEQWREKWADIQNREFEKAGLEVRVDHRSLEAQGIDREPEPKLGAVATKMEREGRESNAGNDLREVWQRNAERAHDRDQQERIELEIAHGRMQQLQEERRGFDDLYLAEKQRIEQEKQQYQQQIDQLTSQLQDRSRLSIFVDKLRGRLGWRAEQELAAAQRAAGEAEERKRVLTLSHTQQQQREADYRAKQEHSRQQHTDMALSEMERDALPVSSQTINHETLYMSDSLRKNRNSQISSLEAWDASGVMKMAEQHHAEAQARGMTGKALSELKEQERQNPPTPHLEEQPEHKARSQQEAELSVRVEQYRGMFQAAREQAAQERDIDDGGRDMEVE